MTVYRNSSKCLRDWIVGTPDAAKLIHVSVHLFRQLVDEGYIRAGQRKGFYRVGNIIDGHAEAVRMGRISAPHARGQSPAVFECPLSQERAA